MSWRTKMNTLYWENLMDRFPNKEIQKQYSVQTLGSLQKQKRKIELL